MKYCPACNFSFPDFHRVCDFDGTELISERAPQPNAKSHSTRRCRIVRSAKLLTVVAVFALFLASVVIGYMASRTQPIPMVRIQNWPASLGIKPAASPAVAVLPALAGRAATEQTALRDRANARRAIARARVAKANRLREAQIARATSADPKQKDSDPKLVAALKTTWRVLTKPFRF